MGGGQTPGRTVGNGRAAAIVLAREGVRVAVRERHPLAEAARAHRDLEARRTVGRSILLP
jgi:NADPH2:quinone reductase